MPRPRQSFVMMRLALRTDPKLAALTARLNVPTAHAIGAICLAWMFAYEHADGDVVREIDADALDAVVGLPGFASAMEAVGWLKIRSKSLSFPGFTSHNGLAAERRAKDTNKKRRQRSFVPSTEGHSGDKRYMQGDIEGTLSPERREEKRREEKRREEKREGAATWSRDAGWCVPSSTMGEWSKAFDRVDIAGELARMDTWLRANPAKARKRNWERFVTNWLGRTQETAPPRANVTDDDVMAAMAELDANRRRVES